MTVCGHNGRSTGELKLGIYSGSWVRVCMSAKLISSRSSRCIPHTIKSLRTATIGYNSSMVIKSIKIPYIYCSSDIISPSKPRKSTGRSELTLDEIVVGCSTFSKDKLSMSFTSRFYDDFIRRQTFCLGRYIQCVNR